MQDGHLVRVLKGHGHWVNTLAVSSEHALRTGAFNHHGKAPKDPAAAQQAALERHAPSLNRHLVHVCLPSQNEQACAAQVGDCTCWAARAPGQRQRRFHHVPVAAQHRGQAPGAHDRAPAAHQPGARPALVCAVRQASLKCAPCRGSNCTHAGEVLARRQVASYGLL